MPRQKKFHSRVVYTITGPAKKETTVQRVTEYRDNGEDYVVFRIVPAVRKSGKFRKLRLREQS